MRLLALSTSWLLTQVVGTVYADAGDLYPPGLQPLINRANALLSTGQFNDAVRIYSEAIDQSPADYLLYYKRATALFSMSRHAPALEDFDKVLSLTSGSFDNAYLMKARIQTRDGNFQAAREALDMYVRIKGNRRAGEEALELDRDIEEGERMEAKMEEERAAQLWNACVESATAALRSASHSIDIRSVRAECALASGDVDSAVGDLIRLSNLLPPSTTLLTTIFRLSYFLLPPSPSPLNNLKQCLHFDPDSKPCLTLYRLLKSLDRSFAQLEDLERSENWNGIINLLTTPGASKSKGDFLTRYEDALREHTAREKVLPPQLAHREKVPEIPLPDAMRVSYGRQVLMRALCKAYTQLGSTRETVRWCEELLGMQGCENDVDGLIGRAEGLVKKEEWEEAARVLQKAFDESGRNRSDIHQRMQRVQRLLKQSKQKDYYKVLDVARDADSRTIKKAFRRAAKTAHPDKGGSEAKMAAVNEAYEVLNNPELRQRFDNGEDPNDPMAAQGGHPFFANGQHPFAQFFQQSGPGGHAGGYQFHFSTGH